MTTLATPSTAEPEQVPGEIRAIHFQLLAEASPEALSAKVTEHLASGYRLQGVPFTVSDMGRTMICQLVIGAAAVNPRTGEAQLLFKHIRPLIQPASAVPRIVSKG